MVYQNKYHIHINDDDQLSVIHINIAKNICLNLQ